MRRQNKVYYICEGEITELFNDSEIYEKSDQCDWVEDGLIIASSPAKAKELAELSDRGEIDKDQVFWTNCYGKLIVAIEEKRTD